METTLLEMEWAEDPPWRLKLIAYATNVGSTIVVSNNMYCRYSSTIFVSTSKQSIAKMKIRQDYSSGKTALDITTLLLDSPSNALLRCICSLLDPCCLIWVTLNVCFECHIRLAPVTLRSHFPKLDWLTAEAQMGTLVALSFRMWPVDHTVGILCGLIETLRETHIASQNRMVSLHHPEYKFSNTIELFQGNYLQYYFANLLRYDQKASINFSMALSCAFQIPPHIDFHCDWGGDLEASTTTPNFVARTGINRLYLAQWSPKPNKMAPFHNPCAYRIFFCWESTKWFWIGLQQKLHSFHSIHHAAVARRREKPKQKFLNPSWESRDALFGVGIEGERRDFSKIVLGPSRSWLTQPEPHGHPLQ